MLCKTYFKKDEDAAHQRRIIIMSFHHRVYFFKYNLVPLGVYFECRSDEQENIRNAVQLANRYEGIAALKIL